MNVGIVHAEMFDTRAVLSITCRDHRLNANGSFSAKIVVGRMVGKDPYSYQHLGNDFQEEEAICAQWILRQYPKLPTRTPSNQAGLEVWCQAQLRRFGPKLEIFRLILVDDKRQIRLLPLAVDS